MVLRCPTLHHSKRIFAAPHAGDGLKCGRHDELAFLPALAVSCAIKRLFGIYPVIRRFPAARSLGGAWSGVALSRVRRN